MERDWVPAAALIVADLHDLTFIFTPLLRLALLNPAFFLFTERSTSTLNFSILGTAHGRQVRPVCSAEWRRPHKWQRIAADAAILSVYK